MTFTYKLSKLVEGKDKAQLSRDAKLHPAAIDDYLRTGQMPAADVAMRLSRALGVPLEWMVDDSTDFPFPMQTVDLAFAAKYAALTNQTLTMDLLRQLFCAGLLREEFNRGFAAARNQGRDPQPQSMECN
jgi:hypothetical protein